MNPEFHTVVGLEAEKYMAELDSSIDSLVNCLENRNATHFQRAIQEYGDSQSWDWHRLPKRAETDKVLGSLTRRVHSQYEWLTERDFVDDAELNRKWFERMEISSDSGLPSPFMFIELERLKRSFADELRRLNDYPQLATALRSEILGDNRTERVVKYRENALKRSFLEQLSNSELLKWKTGEHSLEPEAWLQRREGLEELWSITFVDYDLASAQFMTYVVDMWQDRDSGHISEGENGTTISAGLKSALKVPARNDAWYILRKLDETFDNLHPVHVTRGIIGPFELKYRTKPKSTPPFKVMFDILQEDPEACVLRYKRQYAYAPNHSEVGGKLVQNIRREDWYDEIILSPSAHAQKINNSIDGEAVQVIER